VEGVSAAAAAAAIARPSGSREFENAVGYTKVMDAFAKQTR
jgi:hypothetical protein